MKAVLVIKFQALPSKALASTKLSFGTSTFRLYINDLPKIINKTSVLKNFDDENGILFAQSNVIEFNKIFK